MTIRKIFLVGITIIPFINITYSQELPQVTPHAPEIGAALQFEEIPVSPYTGVPNISIPLYSVQSLSKEISVNLSYNYHPAGVSKNVEGKGWSLNAGGFISRKITGSPDELYYRDGALMGTDLYQYSFLGNSGRFILTRDTGSNQLQSQIIEVKSGSPNIKIKIINDPVNFNISSFSINDDKGHVYNFSVYNNVFSNFRIWHPGTTSLNYLIGYRSIFYLSSISDANGNLIINYNYNTTSELQQGLVAYSGPGPHFKIINELQDIEIIGKGKIAFRVAGKDSFDVINIHNDSIKRVDISNSKIIESNFENDDKHIYEFSYKMADVPVTTVSTDMFGYPKRENLCLYPEGTWAANDTDAIYCTTGVLEKIKYPGGGVTKFEFEPNTYDFYFDGPDDFIYQNEPHNFLGNIVFPINNYQYPPIFIVPGSQPKKYYVTIVNPGIPVPPELNPDPNGNPTYQYGTVKIGGVFLLESQSNQNHCLGKEVILYPGPNTLLVNPPNPSVSMTVKELIPVTNLKKWIHGGGNRIKKITYFDGVTKDENGIYFIPVKEINYKYNLFGDEFSTSGRLAYENFHLAGADYRVVSELVGYKNVTVYETGKGRTEYTYISPHDFPVENVMNQTAQHYYDYKRGLELKKTVYSEAGDKLLETETFYEFNEEHIQNPDPSIIEIYERNGSVKKATSVTKEFFTLNNQEKFIENTEIVEVNRRRQPTKKIHISGADSYEKKYYYVNNNTDPNIFPGKFDLEKIEERKNGSLQSTQKTVFGTFPGSINKMPLSMQSAKANEGLEDKAEFISYNQYSNPIEVKRSGGINTIYLWGYNYSVPFAVIENANYSLLPTQLISMARMATDGNNPELTAQAINDLRTSIKNSQPNARITTFVYKPLIGIKSITDPQERTTSYTYDSFGRLETIEDHEGNIVSETKYHFKP